MAAIFQRLESSCFCSASDAILPLFVERDNLRQLHQTDKKERKSELEITCFDMGRDEKDNGLEESKP
ncbi:hypothetical protein QQP08_017317 [Theobroma cacao]|nr:hypothetical protein QQP08_017317 [Theobroma cacao]